MGEALSGRDRHRNARAVAIATHKFAVGVRVFHKPGPHAESGSFRVTSHLPDGGQGLQYRLRSDRDGHERVATESALQRPTPDER
jgi:hypothetical protein